MQNMSNERLPLHRTKQTSPPSSGEDEKPRPVAHERFSDEEMEEIKKGFALRLKDIFDHANNSEIARRCKTTDVTIKYYVDGARLPHPEMLLQIHLATGVNLHWLLTGKGEKRISPDKSFFSEQIENEIQTLARQNGEQFNETLRNLISAALEFRKKIVKG